MNRHAQRGGALVEFAMIAPFMVMLFFAAIEMGWMLYLYQSVDYGARLGARYAMVRGAVCSSNSGDPNCPTTPTLVQTYVQGAVPGLGSATVTPVWSAPTGTTQAPSSACGKNNEAPGCVVSVTVAVTQNFTIPFIFTNKSFTIASTSQAIVQQ